MKQHVTGQLVQSLLAADEIDELRRCIVEHASADEANEVERLLGQLATLNAVRSGDEHRFGWTPPPGTEDLATRALEALRYRPVRRRFQRAHNAEPPAVPPGGRTARPRK